MPKKKFALLADQIKPLAENRGACFATDKIVVEGQKVGYMYREEPDNSLDSGWRFMSGQESEEYMDNPANHGIYDVNTIANYDTDIVRLLDAPIGSAFERQTDRFVQIEGQPWDANENSTANEKGWPPPGFPLVEGDYALTPTWSIHLPEPFARRVEEGSLVLWRPGMTIWLNIWGNDHQESQDERLARIIQSASPGRSSEQQSIADGITRYRYRMSDKNEGGTVEALYAFILNEDGYLQMAVYFDSLDDEAIVHQLVDSVTGSLI